MLKLKLQYSGHLMWRTDWLEKTLMLGKIESRRRRMTEDEMAGWHHQHNGHILSKLWEIVKDREASHSEAHCVKNSPTWLSDWTTSCRSTLKIHHRVKVVFFVKNWERFEVGSPARTKVLIFQCKRSNTSVHPPTSQWNEGLEASLTVKSIFSGLSVQFAGSFNVLPSDSGL